MGLRDRCGSQRDQCLWVFVGESGVGCGLMVVVGWVGFGLVVAVDCVGNLLGSINYIILISRRKIKVGMQDVL